MMNIARVTLREIRLALKEPFVISSGVESERRILLVEVTDVTGATGWGECVAMSAPNYSPETIDTAWLMIRDFAAPRIVGLRCDGPETVHELLGRGFRGHNMAKAAVEMAVWALAAEMQGVALSRLLGGTRDRIETGISLGIQKDPETLVDKARAALTEGYARVKVKIKPGQDIAYLRALREALGPEAPIMADANSAYTLDDRDTLKALDRFGLMMIEQPLAWDDIVRHAKLQRELETPVCLDESITSLDRAEDMIELGAGRIINVKPGRVGGLAAAKAIHDLCRRSGVPVWCGGMLESGIGRAFNVALASLPNFVLPGDISPSARYWARDIVRPEWVMDGEGRVSVPRDKPGLGVDVDIERIEALTVHRETIAGP